MRVHRRMFAPACGLTAAMALVVAAGAAGPDNTSQNRDKDKGMQPAHQADQKARHDARDKGPTHFVTADKMIGTGVIGVRDEAVGDISDLIIDRGSGRVQFLVLTTGATLGMGGKNVVVPYDSFGWNPVEDQVMLTTTKDQMQAWPEFQKDRWLTGARDPDSLVRYLAMPYYKHGNDWGPFPDNNQAARTQVKGKITGVNRSPMAGDTEKTVVVVTADDGSTREIVIGPSWYLAGNNIRLYRDAPVDLTVVRVQRDGSEKLLAQTGTIDSQPIALYDADGRPLWSSSDQAAERGRAFTSPLVLATELRGKNIECRGESCGEIDDLIVECHSGRVAFLAIDPDENVLGIGDKSRLVPWSVAMPGSQDKIALDASKSMILAAPAMPNDVKALNEGDTYRRVYAAFDVRPVSFDPRTGDQMKQDQKQRDNKSGNDASRTDQDKRSGR